MSNYRTRNQAVAAIVETTPGEPANPTVAANAISLEDTTASGNLETVDTNENTGAIDDRGPIPAGGTRAFAGTALLKGSGTVGTAPEAGVLFRGCGMREVLLAANVTGTAVAASAETIELADALGVEVGQMIDAAGQVRVIAELAGAVATVYPPFAPALAAGAAYTVLGGAVYHPTSTGLETLTVRRWRKNSAVGGQAKLDEIPGAAGSFQLTLAVRQPGRVAFSFQGLLREPIDVVDPGLPTLDEVRPVPFLGADIFLGGLATKINTLTLNLNATASMPDNPLDDFGYDAAGITARRVEGRINPPLGLQSVRNAFQSWRDGKVSPLWIRYGTVPGNRVSIFIPELVYTGSEEEDVSGFAHEGLPFRSIRADAGVFIAFS